MIPYNSSEVRPAFGLCFLDLTRHLLLAMESRPPLTARSSPPVAKVKLFVGLLSSGKEVIPAVEEALEGLFGPIDHASALFGWSLTKYYEKEMGSGLVRKFVSFEVLAMPDELATIKRRTIELEERFRDSLSRKRRANIDPGYVDVGKVVLASTKNANQRVYLGSGIYAEATLSYEYGSYRPYAHTYTDYQWPQTRDFFARMRTSLRRQLRTSPRREAS